MMPAGVDSRPKIMMAYGWSRRKRIAGLTVGCRQTEGKTDESRTEG